MSPISLSRRQWLAGASALAALGPTGTALAQGTIPAGPAGRRRAA